MINLKENNANTPELLSKIVKWANARNIVSGSTSKDQFCKLMQETGELSDNLCKGRSPIDDIGDCIVVLAIIAEQRGLTIQACLEHAYNDIKDRRGQMLDGVFVKEADLIRDGATHISSSGQYWKLDGALWSVRTQSSWLVTSGEPCYKMEKL